MRERTPQHVEPRTAEGIGRRPDQSAQPLVTAVQVADDWHSRAGDVPEQHSLLAALLDAFRDSGQLELRIDLSLDDEQLAAIDHLLNELPHHANLQRPVAIFGDAVQRVNARMPSQPKGGGSAMVEFAVIPRRLAFVTIDV